MKLFNLFSIVFLLSSTVLFGQQQDICFGDIRQYSVDLPSGTPGSTYDWTVLETDFQGNITGNSTNIVDIDWGQTPIGTYTLQVIETSNDCPGDPQLLTINIHPLPTLPVVTTNSDICSGNTAEFNISGEIGLTVNYLLNGVAETSVLTNGSVTLPVPNATSNATLQIISVETIYGCAMADGTIYEVIVNPLPTIPTITNNGDICFGDTAEFTIVGDAGSTVTYILDGMQNTEDLDNGQAIISIPDVQSNVNLQLTEIINEFGCSIPLSLSSDIVVNPLPSEPTITPNGPICVGDTATFEISGEPNLIVDYTVDGVAATTTLDSSGNRVLSFNNVMANVNLEITQITNTFNCSTTTSIISEVIVNPIPEAPALSSNGPICYGEDAEFTIQGNPGNLVTYTLDGVQTTITLDTNGAWIITVVGATSDVTLQLNEVENEFGCTQVLSEESIVVVNPEQQTTAINFD